MIRRISLTQMSHGILVCTLIAVSGCAKYKPRELTTQNFNTTTINNVTVGAHALTEDECYKTFSRRIIKKGYQPIQLCIVNNAEQSYLLQAHNIELELESTKVMIEKSQLNTAGRVVSWGAPALFGFGIFLVPALVEGLWSHDANKKLAIDFSQRTISNNTSLRIAPNTIVNRVMFVPKDKMPSSFELTLKGTKDHKNILFNVKPF